MAGIMGRPYFCVLCAMQHEFAITNRMASCGMMSLPM
jgi:hypothetical protein